MLDADAVVACEPLGDERAVARRRVALDAEERRDALGRQRGRDGVEVGAVEDLPRVALDVRVREPRARSLALAGAVVLRVLELAEVGRRRELREVAVADAGLAERRLEALRVRPGVLRAADAAALADVQDLPDARLREGGEERIERPVVDPDRRELPHAGIIAARTGAAR